MHLKKLGHAPRPQKHGNPSVMITLRTDPGYQYACMIHISQHDIYIMDMHACMHAATVPHIARDLFMFGKSIFVFVYENCLREQKQEEKRKKKKEKTCMLLLSINKHLANFLKNNF